MQTELLIFGTILDDIQFNLSSEKHCLKTMKLEVHSAADFLMNLLRVNQQKKPMADDNQLQSFKGSLEALLALRYKSHWYPEVPTKGSGYRCIRINGQMDPLVEQAGVASGLAPRTLRNMLPPELTLWIDPEEVAYRIGENGSICVLYESQSRASPSSDLDSTGSGALSGDEFIMERVGHVDNGSVNSSANSTPTKPTMTVDEDRFFGGVTTSMRRPPSHSPPMLRNGMVKYQQSAQFFRQHIHGAATIQQQAQHWDGFANNNKVSNHIHF